VDPQMECCSCCCHHLCPCCRSSQHGMLVSHEGIQGLQPYYVWVYCPCIQWARDGGDQVGRGGGCGLGMARASPPHPQKPHWLGMARASLGFPMTGGGGYSFGMGLAWGMAWPVWGRHAGGAMRMAWPAWRGDAMQAMAWACMGHGVAGCCVATTSCRGWTMPWPALLDSDLLHARPSGAGTGPSRTGRSVRRLRPAPLQQAWQDGLDRVGTGPPAWP
jgi:hypothetical protein